MELKNLLLPEKVVTFDFPGCEGLTFDLAYLSKEKNQELLKKCQKTKIDPRTRKPFEEFDEDMFLELYVAAIVRGWSGFKMKYLRELVLANISEEEEEKEIDFTQENALTLMKSSVIFDNWVSECISDLGKFTVSKSNSNSKELIDL
jgi:hypothetical protein